MRPGRAGRELTAFTPLHRGGSGPPLVLLHGFTDTAKAVAPHAQALLASPEGRRRATEYTVTNFEHIPAELLAHQLVGHCPQLDVPVETAQLILGLTT